jgi:hypothetical protein
MNPFGSLNFSWLTESIKYVIKNKRKKLHEKEKNEPNA